MHADVFITKGTRVRFRSLRAQRLGSFSLAGVQAKVAATSVEHEGVVTHVRGDHPTHPTEIRLWVRDDDGTEHGPIHPSNIIGVIAHAGGSG